MFSEQKKPFTVKQLFNHCIRNESRFYTLPYPHHLLSNVILSISSRGQPSSEMYISILSIKGASELLQSDFTLFMYEKPRLHAAAEIGRINRISISIRKFWNLCHLPLQQYDSYHFRQFMRNAALRGSGVHYQREPFPLYCLDTPHSKNSDKVMLSFCT